MGYGGRIQRLHRPNFHPSSLGGSTPPSSTASRPSDGIAHPWNGVLDSPPYNPPASLRPPLWPRPAIGHVKSLDSPPYNLIDHIMNFSSLLVSTRHFIHHIIFFYSSLSHLIFTFTYIHIYIYSSEQLEKQRAEHSIQVRMESNTRVLCMVYLEDL